MKNLALLIDANVVMDYLVARQPKCADASHVIMACQKPRIKGFIAFHTLSSIWYILRKLPAEQRRGLLLEAARLLTVASASHEAVVNAIQEERFHDFEDCLQEKCAIDVHADYIVTENTKDFSASAIPAVTSARMLQILYDMREELS